MNCIWDIVLQAAQDGYSSHQIFFKAAKTSSPYMEQSFSRINQAHIEELEVEVNPLARFTPIFEYLLHHDMTDLIFVNQKQFIDYFFDLLMHILADIDLVHGMTRREFYIRQVRRDLLEGIFGEDIRLGMEELKHHQQVIIADELLRVMEIGSNLQSFCRIMKQIFPKCIIYQGRKHPHRIYVYTDENLTPSSEKKWLLIRETFLAFDMEVRVFWQDHFGIMDVNETMRLDRIAIF